jgi:hypothetical protein
MPHPLEEELHSVELFEIFERTTSMACENIKNAFYALTGQVSPRLFNRISINDPWVAYVEKGEWPTAWVTPSIP